MNTSEPVEVDRKDAFAPSALHGTLLALVWGVMRREAGSQGPAPVAGRVRCHVEVQASAPRVR